MILVKLLADFEEFKSGEVIETDNSQELVEKGIGEIVEISDLIQSEVEKTIDEAVEQITSEIKVSTNVETKQFNPIIKEEKKMDKNNILSTVYKMLAEGEQKQAVEFWQKAVTGMSEGTAADGGNAVRIAYGDIQTPNYTYKPIWQLAQYFQVNTSSIQIPYIDDTTHATNSVGGSAMHSHDVTTEGTQKTAAKLAFGKASITLESDATYVPSTNQLIEDVANLGSIVNMYARLGLDRNRDDGIIAGTGTGFVGLLDSAALLKVVTRATTVTIGAADVAGMLAGLAPGSLATACWLVSPTAYAKILQLTNTATGFQNDYSQSPAGTLYGRPIFINESCKSVGTSGDIILVDLTKYAFADHTGGVKVAYSEHIRFDYNESVWRFEQRVGGAPLWSSVITTAGGDTVSPCVVLSTL